MAIPQMDFIGDVEKFMDNKDVTEILKFFDEQHQKYRFLEINLMQKRARLRNQIPDIQRSLEIIELLEKKDTLDTQFLMSSQLYAKAKIPPTDTVCLWLGANVMLEYSLDEAKSLLNKNLEQSTSNLEQLAKDLEFLRDQITTSEVNLARVYNWNVKRKNIEKSKS